MKRKTFRIIFILFTLLCFAAFCGLQLQIRNQQATRQWADFVYWLGDEPQNLQQLPAKNGTYTFRFHADAEWIQQTATTLRLQQQPHTEAQPSTLYTADSARSLAELGDAEAALRVAHYYETGCKENRGMMQDDAQARHFRTLAQSSTH
jgi:hypothetical protein